ncbi:hypothetical protein HMPREF0980_02978 [Dorea sp. D27]|nr:hypothetical protein HMPREF0980_02978 [Dorea sp. D27]
MIPTDGSMRNINSLEASVNLFGGGLGNSKAAAFRLQIDLCAAGEFGSQYEITAAAAQ